MEYKMRPRETMLLFSFFFLIISGFAIVKSVGHFSIFGMAISDKVAGFPASPLLYLILIFILAIIAILIAISQRKIVY